MSKSVPARSTRSLPICAQGAASSDPVGAVWDKGERDRYRSRDREVGTTSVDCVVPGRSSGGIEFSKVALSTSRLGCVHSPGTFPESSSSLLRRAASEIILVDHSLWTFFFCILSSTVLQTFSMFFRCLKTELSGRETEAAANLEFFGPATPLPRRARLRR